MPHIELMYHDIFVSGPYESGFKNGIQYKVKSTVFEEHLKAVSAYCREHEDTTVSFSFDDGGVSAVTRAAGLLEKYGFRGLFFISTAYTGTPGFLSTEQIAELRSRGHRIGSHAHTHSDMRRLSANECEKEWRRSVSVLAPWLSPEPEASLPGGNCDRRVLAAARKAGITVMYTSEPTVSRSHRCGMRIVGRFAVYQDMGAEDVVAILSDARERLYLNLRYKALTIAQTLLGSRYHSLKKRILLKNYNIKQC